MPPSDEAKYTIHIVGAIEDGNFQCCVNCRETLIDYRNVIPMSADGSGPCFWSEGARIGRRGNMSFMVPDRPLEADEELCDEDAFGVGLGLVQ